MTEYFLFLLKGWLVIFFCAGHMDNRVVYDVCMGHQGNRSSQTDSGDVYFLYSDAYTALLDCLSCNRLTPMVARGKVPNSH